MAAGDVEVGIVSPSARAGAYFDGVDDKVVVPSNDSFDLNKPFTINLWVKLASLLTNSQFISRFNNLVVWWSIGTTATSNWRFQFDDDVTKLDYQNNTSMALNLWNMISYVRTDTHEKIFINGVEKTSLVIEADIDNSDDIWFGSDETNNQWFKGWLSDIKFYHAALTADELLAEVGGANIVRGLKHHWPLRDDYTDIVGGIDGVNSGSRLGISDINIAAAIKAARVSANDTFLLTECANGLQVVIPTIEEAP